MRVWLANAIWQEGEKENLEDKQQNGVQCTTYIQSGNWTGVYFGFSSRFNTGVGSDTQSTIDGELLYRRIKGSAHPPKGSWWIRTRSFVADERQEENLFFGQILGHC